MATVERCEQCGGPVSLPEGMDWQCDDPDCSCHEVRAIDVLPELLRMFEDMEADMDAVQGHGVHWWAAKVALSDLLAKLGLDTYEAIEAAIREATDARNADLP